MAIKDKKDVSVLIEAQIPEFVTQEHPKFKQFIERYYEFMESQQVYFTGFTFDEGKLVDESDGTSYFLYEDDVRIQLESERDTLANANLQFLIGETLTGNTSTATAVVTGTKGNTLAFIKPTNEATFRLDEKITGSTSRAYAVLANGVSANVFPAGSIESFRSRGAIAATRELESMQDIDRTNEGLIDDAWKKEFYTNIPTNTETDRRQLLKNMKEVYQAKGNESSFTWLFRSLYAKEDVEFYYPKTDMSKLSDGRWTLDASVKILTSTANNLNLFTGKKITGASSNATGIVETSITSFAGTLQVTELTLSDVRQGIDADGALANFSVGEAIQTEADANGDIAIGYTLGTSVSITVNAGGSDYVVGDEITIEGGGGADARARVASTQNNVIQTVTLVDAGDGYQINDPVGFIDEGTGGTGAAAKVGTIIKTGEALVNSEIIDDYAEQTIGAATVLVSSTSNSHLYGNSSLIFTAGIKSSTAKYLDSTANFANSHLAPGDRISKQTSIDETDAGQLTQSGTTVTFATGITDALMIYIVGGKLTYANGNNTIITNFTNTTTLTVKDSHTIGSAQDWDIYYKSNTYWGTIIGANSTQILYAIGSYKHDEDLSTFSSNNFSNNDSIIVYDVNKTKAWAAKSSNSHDSHITHTGVTFDIGNTPASVTATSYTTVDGQGPLYPADLVQDTTGGFSMTTVNIGAIDTISMTTVGSEYATTPAVTISNNHIQIYQNARDVLGVTSTLINVNLYSYDTGTITQSGSVITLTGGAFPDANSGLNKITYANGFTDTIVTVTNTTSLIMSTERLVTSAETYDLTYGAIANNFTRNTFLYNDDFTARGITLDFIDQAISRKGKPAIATGNSVFRVHMLTAEDFGAVEEFLLLESRDLDNTPEKILFEDDTVGVSVYNKILVETSVEFLSQENGTTDSLLGDVILREDGTTNTPNSSTEGRIWSEDTTGDRVTAYSNVASTYTINTITQSGTTITGIGTTFPNDLVRGTITYADDTTSLITGYTNATSFTVEDSKTVGSAQAYSISYNPAVTWGEGRAITVSAGGTGNRTVTATESGHYLNTGDKVKISGSGTKIFNGVYSITIANNSTYTYTLPEDTSVTSPTGSHIATPVASAWLTTSNAITMDTSPKGNNATIAVLSIATGSIKTVEVYNFGAGYTSAPTISAAGGNQDASFTANLGAYGEYSGYYTGTQGLLSGVPKIQDGNYYQDFSYVLKTDFDVNIFRNDVKRITHPSGMVMFGELAIRNKVSARMFDDGQSGNVDSLTPTDTRKNHTLEVTINSYANLQYQSSNTQNELEIFTADHPWQAMDARLEVRDDNNLLEENFRDVTVARTNSTTFTVTDTLHGLAAGDTIQIAGYPQTLNETDYWDGKYVIQTIPTTNTYTVTVQRGDPGASVTADPYFYIVMDSSDGSADAGDNILTEQAESFIYEGSVEYLKVETKLLANVWLSNSANWNNPFNGGILDEAGDDVLLELGGSYLYPKLQFPIAETGTVSINMSFNSDLLLEDYTTGDLGMSDSGYLLDEASGSVGTGPARYISLEEDSEGPDHQYESIPIVDTHVTFSLLDSMRQGFLTEDGLDNLVCDDADSGEGIPASRLITERFGITDGAFAPTMQHLSFLSGLGNIVTEDGYLITNEEISVGERVSHIREESDYNSSFASTVEFDLYDTMGWHFLTEDGLTHLIYEDGTRSILELSSMELSDRPGSKTIIPYGQPAATVRTITGHFANAVINNYKEDTVGLSTFGMQVFRPHYTSQWNSPTTDIGFTHDRMSLDNEVGFLLAEDDVLVTNHILFEDGPFAGTDLMNSGEAYSEFFGLEDQAAGNNILEEDGSTDTASSTGNQMLTEFSRTSPGEYLIHQSWKVLPTYQYSRVLTRLQGQIAIPHNSTTVTGTNTTFTSQVRVGEIFQTVDENILTEESGGGITLETDERIRHEDITISDVQNVALTTEVLGLVPYEDFHWFLTNEDAVLGEHITHPGVIGTYSDWDTGFYFVTSESNAGESDVGTRLGQEDDSSILELETLEWETDDLQLEDGSKILLTDPGEFRIAAIASDTSLTVTRKHWGGTDAVIWRQ